MRTAKNIFMAIAGSALALCVGRWAGSVHGETLFVPNDHIIGDVSDPEWDSQSHPRRQPGPGSSIGCGVDPTIDLHGRTTSESDIAVEAARRNPIATVVVLLARVTPEHHCDQADMVYMDGKPWCRVFAYDMWPAVTK